MPAHRFSILCTAIAASLGFGGARALAWNEAAPPAHERTVQRLQLKPLPNGPEVEVWLTRARGEEGALTIRLVERGVGEHPQALTIYRGGGGDDSAGDDDLRALKGSVMALPGGRNVVRVDFTFHPAGGQPGDEETDTTLVGFAGPKTHRLLKLKTRLALTRSPVCSELAEVTLRPDAALDQDGSFFVTAVAQNRAQPKLGDDDEPLDPSCRAPAGTEEKKYRFDGQRLALWVPPPPAPPPAPAATPDGGAAPPAPPAKAANPATSQQKDGETDD